MNRLLTRANARISLGGAAALLVVAAALSQVLGVLRVKIVNANFPPLGPDSTDAFFAAFKIPDLIFFTIAAGALGVAFMPFLADRLNKGDRKGVWELSNSLLNLLAILMFFVGIIILVFADPLIRHIVAPGLIIEDPQQHENAVAIMRLVAFNPLLFAVAGILTSVQQTFGRFFFFAVAPLFYNVSIIVSAMVFSTLSPTNGGPAELGLVGLGVGALVGAVLQLLVVIFGFAGLKYTYRTIINFKNPNFRGILRQLPPRSADQGVDSINSVVETNLATRLGSGKLTAYENAFVLQNAPTMLIGTTLSTAAFPRLNDRLSQGRPDLFRRDFLKVLRLIIWLIMPVVVICYFCRGYLARLIFSRDAPEIAIIFGFFVVAILFRTIYTIISRWFYAQKDTKTPLFVSLFAIALNIGLAFALSRPDVYGVEGLAMAQSIVATAEVIILLVIMVIRDHKLLDSYFLSGLGRILSVTGFCIVAAYTMVSLLPLEASDRGFITLTTKLGAITGVTFLVYFTLSTLFDLDETKPVLRKLKQLILAPVKIQ